MLEIIWGVFGMVVLSVFSGGVFWDLVGIGFFFISFFSLFFLFSFGWFDYVGVLGGDSLSFCLVLLSCWISGLMILASYKVKLFGQLGGFSFCVSVLCFVLVLAFSMGSGFFFYLFFELSLFPTLLLILGWGYQPERIQAGMYMMMYTIVASLPLLLVILFQVFFGGHSYFCFPWFSVVSGWWGSLCWFCLIFAFLVKAPMYVFHLWLPKAHVEAPVAGSMILAGVLLKLGGYGLLRVSEKFSLLMVFHVDGLVSLVLWGGVLTGFICLRQVDVKALIAYSSVGHMALFLAGVMSGTVWGWHGGLLIMLAHGLCSSALFSLANVNYECLGTRSVFLSKGMLVFFPALVFWWFLFCASNMAAPPSMNLGGELILLGSVLSMSSGWFVVLGLLSFLAGAYSLFLYVSGQHGGFVVSWGIFSFPKFRVFLMLFLHWVPLSGFFLSFDLVSSWVS